MIIRTFVKAIMAGAAVSLGGTVYLSVENPAVGAFLFSLGLFTIFTFGFNLYTGKVCYIPSQPRSYLGTVAVIFFGNLAGTVGMGYLFRATKLVKLVPRVQEMALAKLSDTLFSTFVMAFFCGIMMCIAVLGFQTVQSDVGKHLALVLPIMVFIFCGFEHSVADMFYFSLANCWDLKAVLYLAVIAIGNLFGGMAIPLIVRFTDGKEFSI